MMLRARLFVIAYAPLLAISAITKIPSGSLDWPDGARDIISWPWLPSLILLLTSTWGVWDAYSLVRAGRATGKSKVRIENVTDEGSNAAGYLSMYLIPFIAMGASGWRTAISLALLVAVLFIISVRSNFGLVNPTLYILGWKIFRANQNVAAGGGEPEERIIISKRTPHTGIITVKNMPGGYWLMEEAA